MVHMYVSVHSILVQNLTTRIVTITISSLNERLYTILFNQNIFSHNHTWTFENWQVCRKVPAQATCVTLKSRL